MSLCRPFRIPQARDLNDATLLSAIRPQHSALGPHQHSWVRRTAPMASANTVSYMLRNLATLATGCHGLSL